MVSQIQYEKILDLGIVFLLHKVSKDIERQQQAFNFKEAHSIKAKLLNA